MSQPTAVFHRWVSRIALLSAALLPPTAAQAVITEFTSGAHFFKRVVTNNQPQTTKQLEFGLLPGATTIVFVPGQTIVLINVGFSAETRCSGGAAGTLAWCELEITIGGVEGYPQASTTGAGTFAMDSSDGGTEGMGSWESHAFTRHRCIRNEGTAPIMVPVAVNWKITNAVAADPPEFWVDDSALVVEMSRGCNQRDLPGTNANPSVDLQQSAGIQTIEETLS